MLLRTLWSRAGLLNSAERKPLCLFASSSLSQSVHLHKYEPKHRTSSNCSLSQLFPRTQHISLAACKTLSSLLIQPGLVTNCQSKQKRFYSTDLVKSVLKSAMKPAVVTAKRVPKGPRTKQPSRANQPSQDEDQVFLDRH